MRNLGIKKSEELRGTFLESTSVSESETNQKTLLYVYVYLHLGATTNPLAVEEGSGSILHFHFTLLHFTLLHFTLLYFTLLYFTLLYFTSLYFTSLHFTSCRRCSRSAVAGAVAVAEEGIASYLASYLPSQLPTSVMIRESGRAESCQPYLTYFGSIWLDRLRLTQLSSAYPTTTPLTCLLNSIPF
jgi:hypothetical protein